MKLLLMKLIVIKNLVIFEQLTNFLEAERLATEEKSMNISFKCEQFLEKIVEQLDEKESEEEEQDVVISDIIDYFDENKISISEADLNDANQMGFTGDILVDGDKNTTARVKYKKLKKALPAIRLLNAIKRENSKKSKSYQEK